MDDLTPQEIKLLMDSGKLGPEHIAAFTPQEQAIYQKLQGAAGKAKLSSDPMNMYPKPGDDNFDRSVKLPGWAPQAAQAVGGLAAGGASLGASGIKALLSEIMPMLKIGAVGTGLHYGAKAIGIPSQVADMATLGMSMKDWSKGARGVGAAAAEAPAEADVLRRELEEAGFGKINPSKVLQRKTSGSPYPPNVDRPRTLDKLDTSGDIRERVTQGGVTNDFTPGKRVTFDKSKPAQRKYEDINLRDAYPSNISTGADEADIRELLTGSSHGRGESPTPVMFHGESGPELRKLIEDLKKKVQRRNP